MDERVAWCVMRDCDRPAERAGLCATHRKRILRGQDPSAPIPQRPPTVLAGLVEASIELVDTPSEDDAAWRAALATLRRWAQRYAEVVSREPPLPEEQEGQEGGP